MPKFGADSITKVEYDFSGFEDNNGNSIQDAGFVPEPSRELVNATMKKITAAFEDLGVSGVGDDPNAISAAMKAKEGATGESQDDTFDAMALAVLESMAELCGNSYSISKSYRDGKEVEEKVWDDAGKPSYSNLNRLKYRPFMGFFQYVMGEMMSPEGSTPGTKDSSPGTGRILRSV